MTWRLDQIARWIDADLIAGADQGAHAPSLDAICVDTRQPVDQDALFVALQGPHFDGHDFVDQAFQRGAAAAIVDRRAPQWNPWLDDGRALLVVDDTLQALQAMAAHWRHSFDIPVVAITGSNGKTIVKDMLAAIASQAMTVHRSPGSFNSQVGVALSLLGLRQEHDLAVIEAGISQVGEMARLQTMIEPTHGILTNIGLAHAAGLPSLTITAREKRQLFAHTDGPVVLPTDVEQLQPPQFHVKHPLWVGPHPGDDFPHDGDYLGVQRHRGRGHCDDPNTQTFELHRPQGPPLAIDLHLPGDHNVQNAAQAAALALSLGFDDRAIQQGLKTYRLRSMRLEIHTTGTGITLINDAYNADPASVRAALTVLDRYAGDHRRVAVLGDMLDLGKRAPAAHRQIGAHVAHLGIDALFCVGHLARHIGAGAEEAGMDPDAIASVDDLHQLHPLLDDHLHPGDVLLLKASRDLGLDRAATRLLESVAATRLYVDLDAIAHNFHALKRHLDDVAVMAVVKSFGYGNDATRISQTLVAQGVDALAVAFPDEAIPLRRHHLNIPIAVTNARAEEADKLVKYRLQPLVYTDAVLQALADEARRQGRSVAIHLAIDTGMRRAGLRPQDVLPFARRVQRTPGLSIAGTMTHLAAADMPREDDFTAAQLQRFDRAVADLNEAGIDPGLLHVANTATAWRFPQARYDMIRIGLGIYGLHPSEAVADEAHTTRAALRLTSRILHTHRVDPGDTVGYGRRWKAPSPRRLATVAAGYNDGIPYFLSNQGHVLIAGQRCPIVGSVCMDATMVDITDTDAQVGDEVVFFGHQQGAHLAIDEWADLGPTINYELLCNISPRVRRIFLSLPD